MLIPVTRINEVNDANLKEEFRSCQHFRVDSEIKPARHKVSKYAIDNLNAKIVDEKLVQFFNNLRRAGKVNLVYGFILKNMADEGFRYFYAHENNTLLDRSKLVCTRDDWAMLKGFVKKIYVIESRIRERSTK